MSTKGKAQAAEVGLRAALYLRVSTGKQAEADLSIPDQRRQALSFCKARGWDVAMEFVEAGASATDDKRPEFQRMLDVATGGAAPFNVVLVHSFSRFFRDHFKLEYHVRRLKKAGVRLVSVTQDLGEDPMSVMVRQVFALFDEYQSKETGKHTLRAMEENARQGFWNGSRPPYGYVVVDGEQRGAKIKKRLAVDLVEAEIVRLIFRLFREGDGATGPLGVKKVTCWLNDRGHRTRGGARWGIGQVHAILTRTTYKGEHRFNRKVWKTREAKPESDQIVVPVERVIDRDEFDAVQAALKARNPKVRPPREVTGPVLLTGLVTCGHCGGGMTTRTGKGNGGLFRYYCCSRKLRQGSGACRGRSVRMDKFDALITKLLVERLLTVEKVAKLLTKFAGRQALRAEDREQRLTGLRAKLEEAQGRLTRLYGAIEAGVVDVSDPTLRERVGALKTERDVAQIALDRAMKELNPGVQITEDKIAAFAAQMRKNVAEGETAFRRMYIQGVVDEIQLHERDVRIIGRKSALEELLLSTGQDGGMVRSFVRGWRSRQDLNLRPSA